MSEYTPTIGLEIHAQLKTRTKMFCNSKNDADETKPNVNVCPVCMGHPGTLPTLNKEAIKHVLKVGVAVGGALADFTEWDRKNYFYPDIPKGYQISQYKYPLVTGGSVNGVELTRIHLEEDTGRNIHTDDGSLIDFNRAGIPLMELVTEPVIYSAEEAGQFAKEFQLLLRYLGVSDANMEKGEMRVEANISVSKTSNFGTKVEIKNLNSFKAVERGIAYEVERQVKELESGGEVVQETRGWDDNKQVTFSQRKKEGSADYRYFPEPDLPKMKLSEIPEFSEDVLRKDLPELPWEKRARYIEHGLGEDQAELLVSDMELAGFFDETIENMSDGERTLAANYLTSDVAGARAEGAVLSFSSGHFASLIKMVTDGDLSSRGAKDVLKLMFESEEGPQVLAEREGLLQKSDEGELKTIAERIVADNPSVVEDFKSGKESALQFLIGQGMKATKGSANPAILQKIFKELLQ